MKGLAAGALALASLALGGGGVAQAQSGPVLENGKTKAVYDYRSAIRERVFIPQPGIDQDRNGQEDWVTIDIIRPAEGSATNKMPAIIDPSPYYTTVCRGNETQCMADWNADGVNDRWPLFHDNYFVPRGYAYILAQMNGTGYTENGCPMHGGPGDIAGEKSVVDWLNGRVPGFKAASRTSDPVLATWHNGSSAMIGKSYDGTLSNGVAATGVEGLKTIVPISAISAWYNYSRTGGVRHNTNYPQSLNNNVTTGPTPPAGVSLPNRRTICSPINADISNDANVDTGDGDAHGDINTFWKERDYNLDVSKVKAAVFATHGFQDDNVRMDHLGMWWDGLKANNVPRKLWLLRAGHTDPFESRRAVWVDTLHRWFDHWLYNVDNGIEREPAVTIEDEKDTWGEYADWPIPGTENVDVFLRGTDNAAAAGTLGGSANGGAADALTFTALNNTSESTLMNSPNGAQTNRRVFITQPLTQDVRLSGTARVDLLASLGQTQSNLSVIIADYGQGTQVTRSGEGISNSSTRTCWGDTGVNAVTGEGGPACANLGDTCTASVREIDTACYLEVTKPTQNVTQWRVTRGLLDSSNRDSLWFADASPVTIGQKYHFKFPTMPTEHTFKAGHQIAIIVAGYNGQASSGQGTTNVPVTLDTRLSKVTLPIKGGYRALATAGATDAETVPPVIGDAPDVTVHTADPNGTIVNYTVPTATDNEDPNPTVTCAPASGSTFTVGSTVVTCTAKDLSGNTSTKSFNVIVGFDSTVGGDVPATLSLTLGAAPTFGTFMPGLANTYTASTTATVLSTAGDATLTVADPSAVGTGHLVNGTFVLPEPLQARANTSAYANVGSSASPLTLLTYSAPVSNDAVTLGFSQKVNANDALRTGTYSKALTYTLSTTTP
ncbi:MAG TPA: CocE/NonD family hydrolase [Solirubrobacter sp.]|nr:CocE/NonD family hydrolase [Solirubrobacter sp.]